ncbi:hypothetical protein Glove_109g190 [Diversispora epigaea]|uniref:Uncharacterized protein n=1 Tax=Diversispora epigaea TaxID=1348612 RepID=A0A397J297_9GLOM|nr:hypothetical protein Glove_109g190 [Diversispora epigaea]
MIGEYTCPFYHNSGKVCGKTCMRPEGCSYHWKAKIRTPCIECGKPTGSTSGGTMWFNTIIDYVLGLQNWILDN